MVACKCVPSLLRIHRGAQIRRQNRAMLTRSGARKGAHTTTARSLHIFFDGADSILTSKVAGKRNFTG